MKVSQVVMALALAAVISVPASAQADIGFKGVGGQLGLISISEGDAGSTIGFGAFAELGTIMPNLALQAGVDFWSKSWDTGNSDVEYSWRDIAIGAAVRYEFPINNPKLVPYAMGGLALHFFNAEVTSTNNFFGDFSSDASSTDLGVDLGGGARYKMNDQFTLIGQILYRLADADVFAIMVGGSFALGQ